MLRRSGLTPNPHGAVEVSEMGVDPIAVSPDQDEFPRLVGGNGQADAELFQNLRQVAGEDAFKILFFPLMILVFIHRR